MAAFTGNLFRGLDPDPFKVTDPIAMVQTNRMRAAWRGCGSFRPGGAFAAFCGVAVAGGGGAAGGRVVSEVIGPPSSRRTAELTPP